MNIPICIKRNIRKDIKYILILILLVFFFLISVWCKVRWEIRHTLAEAKNIELALRLIAIEYCGNDQRVYDSLHPDGLTEGTAQIIEKLSGAEGTLVLGSWDAVRGAANQFVYETENFTVMYYCDEQKEHHWQIYYKLKEAKMPYGG